MGLLDTPQGNEICTDSKRNYCFTAEHFELVFSIIQNITVAARVFKPAMMQRAGVPFDAPIVEAYYAGKPYFNTENRFHNFVVIVFVQFQNLKLSSTHDF